MNLICHIFLMETMTELLEPLSTPLTKQSNLIIIIIIIF